MRDREPTYSVVFLPHDGRRPWRRDNLTLERATWFCERDDVEALLICAESSWSWVTRPVDPRQAPWEHLLHNFGFGFEHHRERILGHISMRGVAVIGYIPPALPPTAWEHLLREGGL